MSRVLAWASAGSIVTSTMALQTRVLSSMIILRDIVGNRRYYFLGGLFFLLYN